MDHFFPLFSHIGIFLTKNRKKKTKLKTTPKKEKGEHLDTDLIISRENSEGTSAQLKVYASLSYSETVYISLDVFMFYSLLNQSLALLGLNLLGKPVNLLWFIS